MPMEGDLLALLLQLLTVKLNASLLKSTYETLQIVVMVSVIHAMDYYVICNSLYTG